MTYYILAYWVIGFIATVSCIVLLEALMIKIVKIRPISCALLYIVWPAFTVVTLFLFIGRTIVYLSDKLIEKWRKANEHSRRESPADHQAGRVEKPGTILCGKRMEQSKNCQAAQCSGRNCTCDSAEEGRECVSSKYFSTT